MCRYIKDTNIKNSAEGLNALINRLTLDVKTWTPQPGAVLDLGLALRGPINRLATPQALCVCFVCVCVCICVFYYVFFDYGKRKGLFVQSADYT